MEISMRFILTIGLASLSLVTGGCDRAETSTAANALATPGSANATPTTSTVPGTTAAQKDAAARTSGSAPAASSGSASTAAPAPVWRELTIPAGTNLPVLLDTSVASDTSHVEQAVTAHLSRGVVIAGETVLPEGSRVTGVVTDAVQSAKVKGRAHLAVRFDSVTPRGDDQRYQFRSSAISRTAAAEKQKDAMKIGAPAAGGAIIGGLLGGKKGALIGTAAGGGAGTAVVLSTKGKEVSLPRGTALTVKLAEPLTVRIRS
jgi:hypothetical protein